VTTSASDFKEIIGALPRFREAAERLRELLLGNLVMIGEIPAPTFSEKPRIDFLCQRFTEAGLQNCAPDEFGNALAILPGTGGGKSIVLTAHADTVFPDTTDHSIAVEVDRVVGPGVGTNSLGLAVLATLPTLLEALEIRLASDLIFVGAVNSLGRGDLAGLRFFLENASMPLRAGLCIEGGRLGRLSFSSMGLVRGDITVTVPEEYDWTQHGMTSAVIPLTSVIDHIVAIPLPQVPRTRITIGSIHSGTTYNTIPTHAFLRFEVRSESADMVEQIEQKIEGIVLNVSGGSRADVKLEIVARRPPGAMEAGHPLARSMGAVITGLGIEPTTAPSTSEISVFIARKIPAITLGMSTVDNHDEIDESVAIPPLSAGLAQVVAGLLAVDGGFCDAH
jgi:tripeptide aminopeptidase